MLLDVPSLIPRATLNKKSKEIYVYNIIDDFLSVWRRQCCGYYCFLFCCRFGVFVECGFVFVILLLLFILLCWFLLFLLFSQKQFQTKNNKKEYQDVFKKESRRFLLKTYDLSKWWKRDYTEGQIFILNFWTDLLKIKFFFFLNYSAQQFSFVP